MVKSTATRKQLFGRIFKIIFVVSACIIILNVVDVDEFYEILTNISVAFLGITMFVSMADKIFMGFKWQYLLQAFTIQVPLSVPIIATIRSKVFQFLVPTTIGQDAYKVFYLNQSGADVSRTVSSIVAERLLGLFSSLAIISLLIYFPLNRFNVPYAGWSAAGGLIVFGLITGLIYGMMRFSGYLNHLPFIGFLPDGWRRKFVRFAEIIASAGHSHSKIWRFYFLSIIEKIAYGSAIYFSARAVGIENIEYIYVISAAPFLALLERLPVSIASIGVKEGLVVLLLRPYGIDPTVAISAALALRTAEISMMLLCMFLWLGRHDGKNYLDRIKQMQL